MATRLYVGNLPHSTDNEQLAQLFATYGDVVEALVIMDRASGRSKGFGFVEMSTDEAARAAIAGLDSTQLDGRTIAVSEAKARPERPS